MRLLINIPKEFERHFQTDRFEDSLHRLSADAHLLAGNYEQETAVMLIEAFKAAVSVPPHGRLIDASEKIRVIMYDDMTEDYFRAEMTIDDLLSHKDWVEADVPTIIPAEEGET